MPATRSKNMKIIFVVRYFYPFIGGLEKKVLNLASALRKKGVGVEIITSRFSREWTAREVIKGVPVHRLPSPRIKILGAIIYLISLSAYLIKNRSSFETIHTFQVGYNSAAAVFAGKLLSKKTILTLSSSGYGGDINRHRKTPWGIVFLFLCRLASAIIVLNQKMASELKAAGYSPNSIVSISNGVDINSYRASENKKTLKNKMGIGDEKVIIYTGRLSKEKGLDFLIRSWTKLTTDTPVKLYILGDGPDKSALEHLIKKHKLEKQVTILPGVDEVREYLCMSDIFVMPSQFEGLSNSILEAMVCGLPVVATRVEGNEELIDDGITGLLIEKDNEISMANAISSLLTNPDKAYRLSRQAQEMVQKKHNLNIVADQHVCLYESLMAS